MLGRKRVRSAECPFIGQSKHFINQTIVDSHNADKMTQIYSKTVSMLFKGANQHFNQSDDCGASRADITNNNVAEVDPSSSGSATNTTNTANTNTTTSPKPEDRIKEVRLLGNGQFVAIGDASRKTPNIPAEADLICVGCSRHSCLQGLCQNCDLALCETCGFGCSDCGIPLCSNCVNLFGCGTADSPCCSRCQMYA